MRYSRIAVIFLIFCCFLFGLYFSSFFKETKKQGIYIPPKPLPTHEPVVIPETTEDELWELVNNWKKEKYGYKYRSNQVLCKYAELRVDEIQKDWSHSGIFSKEEAIRSELNGVKIAENLSKGFRYEEYVLESWLNSPSHRMNLEDEYSRSCIKCKSNYCVQLFAK